jgi:hypothetical protein
MAMLHWRNPLIRMYKRGMEDADLERAVDLTIKCGFSLTGQAYTGAGSVALRRGGKIRATRI